MQWTDIPGWFDFGSVYFEQVQRAKDGARFVEIGAWLGKSTAYMAQKIKESGKQIEFCTVDTWKGGGDPRYNADVALTPSNPKEKFLSNMEECGVRAFVTPIEGDSKLVADQFEDESLDFVFIDGDHQYSGVMNDLIAWWPKVKPGGLLAGHDFDEVGPNSAVIDFVREIKHGFYGDGAASPLGYRCFAIPKPIKEDINIYLALPTYDGRSDTVSTMRACGYAYSGGGTQRVITRHASLLAQNFNSFWCEALNDPTITHFAMLHADILPSVYWLDVLVHELNALDARLISTIVPLKDELGVTSTGIANKDLLWAPLRRFTMSEVMEMPATFDTEQIGYTNRRLILNTGCWMADLRDDRWRLLDQNGELYCHFNIRDRITKHEGSYIAWSESEDFFFSNRAQYLGLKTVATRKVQVEHIGQARYPNDKPWGKWKQDEATRSVWEQLPVGV